MTVRPDQIILLALALLAMLVVTACVSLLSKGRFYHWLRPVSQPRRWVLIGSLMTLGTFIIWFPVWMAWPDAMVSKVLLLLFMIVFFCYCISIKWLSGVVDWWFKRKGWPLR